MELHRIFSARLIILAVYLIVTSWLMFASLDRAFGKGGVASPADKQRPEVSRLSSPLGSPEQAPQDNGVTVRINSDLVTVVTTISKVSLNNPFVLNREDFEILEDGVPQVITNFAREAEQPLQLVMLFDISLSVTKKIEFQRRAAAKFLEHVMRPQDRAALIAFSTDVVIYKEFTSRVPALVNAMKQLKAQGSTSLNDAVYLSADYLKSAQGRRVIVVISDGYDTTSQITLQEALANAQRSDVMIFAIFTGNQNLSEVLGDLMGGRALETLTSETGGVILCPLATPGTEGEETDQQSIKDLDLAFNELAEQLRTQYTLGYFSTNDKRDGSFRNLTVRIKKSGYTMHARRGYYAPRG
jgi:Ca-activated chloride channel homolog